VTIRVLIADDQEIVRAGLATLLDAGLEIEVVGQAADGLHAVALARRLRPDVCLFDIRMPHLDGIEATRQLAGPDVDDPLAVIITTFDDDALIAPGITVRLLARFSHSHEATPPAQPLEPRTVREEETCCLSPWVTHHQPPPTRERIGIIGAIRSDAAITPGFWALPRRWQGEGMLP
jgi:CheY-like chemotaxis protein